ncbi:MAG: hypothetical protein KGI25_02560 [Thaumarchaeota archaeon]|nr:hypothetical protein [Nitrososphaerota archaeon]
MKKSLLVLVVLIIVIAAYYPKMSFEQVEANYSVSANETKFSVPYVINHGKIVSMNIDDQLKAMTISIQTTSKGNMSIDLPRALIDSTQNGTDSHFAILVNGHGVNYKELVTQDHRALLIPVPNGTSSIEIKGTQVIPEFGAIASFILVISVLLTVVIYRYRLGLNLQSKHLKPI